MTPIAPISTINDLFMRVAVAGNPRAVLWQDEFGLWQPISSDQIYQRVRSLAEAFLTWGAKKGDRIALIGENRWEWAVTDFAVLAIGAIDVPIYPTLTGEQVAALVRDAGCRIGVVSRADGTGADPDHGFRRGAGGSDRLQHGGGRRGCPRHGA
jgi:long-chain acyl-CoA synthetase